MSAKSYFGCALAGMALVFVSSAGQAQTFYADLKYSTLREVQMPEVERVELENGMVVFLLEDHEVPLVQMSAQVGVGPVYDPPDEIGLATITWQVLRTGGTLTLSGKRTLARHT